MLRDAVAVQDALKYDEPQDWFFPVRESLGGVFNTMAQRPAPSSW
jgi:hypothetical protein